MASCSWYMIQHHCIEVSHTISQWNITDTSKVASAHICMIAKFCECIANLYLLRALVLKGVEVENGLCGDLQYALSSSKLNVHR